MMKDKNELNFFTFYLKVCPSHHSSGRRATENRKSRGGQKDTRLHSSTACSLVGSGDYAAF